MIYLLYITLIIILDHCKIKTNGTPPGTFAMICTMKDQLNTKNDETLIGHFVLNSLTVDRNVSIRNNENTDGGVDSTILNYWHSFCIKAINELYSHNYS